MLEVIDVIGEHRAVLGLCHRLVQALYDLSQSLDVAHVFGGLKGNPAALSVTGVYHHVTSLEVLRGELFARVAPKLVLLLERIR